jgi:hypothetical protein
MADHRFTARLDHSRSKKEALGLEFPVLHPSAILIEIFSFFPQRLARFRVGNGGGVEGLQQSGNIPSIQLLDPTSNPMLPFSLVVGVEGLSHRPDMLAGMVEIHDLNGLGKMFVGQLPNPGGPIPQENLLGFGKAPPFH